MHSVGAKEKLTMSKPRKVVSRDEKLEELGRDPEFTAIVKKKQESNAANKARMTSVSPEDHVQRLGNYLSEMDSDLSRG